MIPTDFEWYTQAPDAAPVDEYTLRHGPTRTVVARVTRHLDREWVLTVYPHPVSSEGDALRAPTRTYAMRVAEHWLAPQAEPLRQQIARIEDLPAIAEPKRSSRAS